MTWNQTWRACWATVSTTSESPNIPGLQYDPDVLEDGRLTSAIVSPDRPTRWHRGHDRGIRRYGSGIGLNKWMASLVTLVEFVEKRE
jgi:hypothetical protein